MTKEKLQFTGEAPDSGYWGIVGQEEGAVSWSHEGFQYASTPLEDGTDYRRIERTGHDEMERVWRKAHVYRGQSGEYDFARRTLSGKHELMLGLAVAAVGAAGIQAIRKHHKKD